jgi:hypothetical protein
MQPAYYSHVGKLLKRVVVVTAMAQQGTEAARKVADLVLADAYISSYLAQSVCLRYSDVRNIWPFSLGDGARGQHRTCTNGCGKHTGYGRDF